MALRDYRHPDGYADDCVFRVFRRGPAPEAGPLLVAALKRDGTVKPGDGLTVETALRQVLQILYETELPAAKSEV